MFTVGKSPNISGKTKENSKLSNGGFNNWLEILAGKDLQTKLRESEDVDFKFSASNGTAKANTTSRSRVTEHLLMWLLAFLAPATRKFLCYRGTVITILRSRARESFSSMNTTSCSSVFFSVNCLKQL